MNLSIAKFHLMVLGVLENEEYMMLTARAFRNTAVLSGGELLVP
jgi:hypothetical protein